jgi:hypothetical protein
MIIEDQRQECVDLIAHKLSKTAEWRLVQAKRFPGDARNARAAERLAELATAANGLPDDVWEGLKPHYHWSNEKFGEVISATNRNVVFRYSTPDFPTYTRNLLVNVRATFSN